MKSNDVIAIFSQNMKELRVQKGLTQEELSFKAGIHRNYISDTERGRRNVSLKAVEKIAAGLGVTIQELFNNSTITK
ncbi:helix-turn-helix domain-containing protein [Spiroplasma tabanidicola]|uniref:XRE family transcriptional regulator n=1 Tax=Spiroplasma tabanidicola TaxID=324079 RepID=A0A6I6CHK4_9MOLU|nr:helix-turn-helix transcriptional regulator [Spiroplasma tabanidicola]QGS51523.1 XRE family transcriptional regulator [Spiroplasma tabanidicola]